MVGKRLAARATAKTDRIEQIDDTGILFANFYPTTLFSLFLVCFYILFFLTPSYLAVLAPYSVLIAAIYLALRLGDACLIYCALRKNFYLPPPNVMGRRTAVVYDEQGIMPSKSGGHGVVCFILGSQQNQ